MEPGDWIVLLMVAGLAVGCMVRLHHKRGCGCGCGCAHCPQKCKTPLDK